MANNENYKKLSESPLSTKLDSYTMARLANANRAGVDVDDVYSPMLVQLAQSVDTKFPDGVKLYSQLGTIVALSATPAQLLAMIENPDIIYFEASR